MQFVIACEIHASSRTLSISSQAHDRCHPQAHPKYLLSPHTPKTRSINPSLIPILPIAPPVFVAAAAAADPVPVPVPVDELDPDDAEVSALEQFANGHDPAEPLRGGYTDGVVYTA